MLKIGCHFDNANDFHEGLAAVEYKGKWGYKSKSGNWAISPEYSFASDFSDGKALVRRRIILGIEETLYIDKYGYKIR